MFLPLLLHIPIHSVPFSTQRICPPLIAPSFHIVPLSYLFHKDTTPPATTPFLHLASFPIICRNYSSPCFQSVVCFPICSLRKGCQSTYNEFLFSFYSIPCFLHKRFQSSSACFLHSTLYRITLCLPIWFYVSIYD